MNQLNIYRNIFLEKEELMNLQGFLQNSLFKQLLLQATYTYGIVTNDPSKFNKDFQKPDEFKNKVLSLKIINTSYHKQPCET